MELYELGQIIVVQRVGLVEVTAGVELVMANAARLRALLEGRSRLLIRRAEHW